MAKKHMRRPFTLAAGLILIFLAFSDFLDSFDFETLFKGSNIMMIIVGLVLVLFAFAKSGRF